MKKLLITGFEPFGGETINPSWEAVKALPDEINGYELTKICLPVVFGEAAEIVISEAEKINPDVILCIGQAGGRESITPELVGINLRHAEIPDNNGNQPKDELIIQDGEVAQFSTVPVRKITEALNAENISSKVSYSAGAYVCNDLLYTVLTHFRKTKIMAGFIHVPYIPEQNKAPSMEIEKIIKGLEIAIKCL